MKKKFSLGDIIKKINEEQGNKADSKNNAVHDQTTQPSAPQSVQHSDILPKSENDLPAQPFIGISSRRTDLSLRNDSVLSERIAEETVTFKSATDLPPPPQTDRLTVAEEKPGVLPERFFDDTEEEEESFDIFKYVGIILRRKKVVLAVVLLMTIFSIFKYATGVKYYSAFSRLLFKPNNLEIINSTTNGTATGTYGNSFITHLELLKSHAVLSIVSQNLNNKISQEQIFAGLTIKQGETNGQKNDIIELSFKSTNAVMARDVLNELCKTYIEYRRDVNSQETTRLIYKFESQINKLQEELDAKENDLRHFKEDNRMVQLSSETNLTVSKVAAIELALQQTQLSLIETNDRLSVINSQVGKQELDIVQSITFQDPFQSKLAELELQLNSLTTEYSPEHFKVKMLKQQIDNIKAAKIDSLTREAASRTLVKNPIRQSLLQELLNLSVEKSALEGKRIAQEKIIEQLNQDLLKLPSMEQKYAYLERETESILQALRTLKSKYEETKIRRDSQESDLKLLEMAETPKKAIVKVGLSNILIGILLGFVLGFALALLLEYLDQSLKDPRDVERELEIPLLGVVPQIETEKIMSEQSADLTKTMLEPFRALRANIKHIAVQHNFKTFIVCSAIKGEGKTTLSANLAITFSLDSKKVILIDGDLRRSQLHTLFSMEKQRGLSDYLLGNLTIDDIIKPTKHPHLSIVTAGERPDNPAELLGTFRFDLLLKDLRDKADIIIFDSPALLPVSDGIIMAPKIDCCVMVVRALWTPLKAAKQAKNQLKRVGTKIFGGILNGVSLSKAYYPYYYGYYGYSSYKYSYDEEHDRKFSLREFGLKIENKFKEQMKNIRFTIPRYVSVLNIIGRYILKRKTFWVLLVLFLSLAALLIWTDSRPRDTDDEVIKYIGLGGVNQKDSSNQSLISDMAIPSTGIMKREIDSSGVSLTTATLANSGLKDTIRQWIDAFSNRNQNRYLSFYNTTSFKYKDGLYPQWERMVANEFTTSHPLTLRVDSIIAGKSGASFLETMIYVSGVNASDSTAAKTYNLIWQISANGWKIVGQKEIAQE